MLKLAVILLAAAASPLAAELSSGVAEEAWYTSNSIGTLLRRIEENEKTDTDYLLHIRREAGQETHRLFDADKKEVRRTERRYSETGALEEQRVFKEGVQDSLTVYYPSGLVKEEVVYTDGKEDGRFRFSYPPEGATREPPAPGEGHKTMIPLAVTFSRPDAGGFRDEYRYLPSMDFRGVRRIYDDGQEYSSFYNSDKGILIEEWHSFRGLQLLFRYTSLGLIRYMEEYRDGVLVERNAFRYDTGTPTRLKERTTWIIAEGREIRLEYAEDGNPVRESVFEGGARVAVTLYTYSDNLLRRREKRERQGREEWDFFYDEDKKLARENYSRGGILQRILYYEEGPDYDRVDEYYQNGEPFLRLYFAEGNEVKRDILGGGDS